MNNFMHTLEQRAGFGQTDFLEFSKAVQTAGNLNVLDAKQNLSGVPAIRMESLEPVLRATTLREDSFTLWKRLSRRTVNSSITEFATRTDIGGDFASAFHSETSGIRSAKADYERDLVKMKFISTMAEITLMASVQDTIVDVRAEENTAATLRVLRAIEWGNYWGDSSIVPEQFDGVIAQLTAKAPDNIIDLEGVSDTGVLYENVRKAFAKVVTPKGGWGKITDMYLTPNVQTDLDSYLDPAFRVSLNNTDVQYGAPVTAIKTTYGNVSLNNSAWMPDGDFDYLTAPVLARAGRIEETAPLLPTITITPTTDATNTSTFDATKAGIYYYAVASVNEQGEGALSSIDAVTISAGQKVDVEITPPAVPNATGYVIYRSTQDPTNVPTAADLRLVKRVPAADVPADPVTFEDFNLDIPGTSSIFLFDIAPESINFEQLLPLQQFPLYPTNKATIPWAVLMFGALRLGYPKRHFMLKNYVPKTAAWKPHTT